MQRGVEWCDVVCCDVLRSSVKWCGVMRSSEMLCVVVRCGEVRVVWMGWCGGVIWH